ncbi:hypothetical protein Tco_0824751 [Tanacetum coccineum]|uniref:Uncharacterized protein n=1 Tax=Tanacetum coccineum TaxID=301880 RepID=A0ABQ5AQ23_9ASTR
MQLQAKGVGRLNVVLAGSSKNATPPLTSRPTKCMCRAAGALELNNLEAYLDDVDSLDVRKGWIEKSKEELEMFEALDRKSFLVKSGKHKVVVFTKAPPRAYSKPFMRFFTPCGVDGQGAWDAELDMTDSHNYMTKEMLDKLGEMHIDLTILEEERDIDVLLVELVETMDEEKIKEAFDRKYKELEESKPIVEVLENYMTYWKRIRKETNTNRRKSLIREPLMRIVHRLIVGALVHRTGSKEKCQKKELWIMSALEERRFINVAWVIAEYLCKSAPGIKENSVICGGHYVTKIAKSLGYLVYGEVEKCSKPIECEKWTTKMFEKELDLDNYTLLRSTLLPQPPRVTKEQRQEPSGLNLSWGDWNASLNEIERSMPSLGGTSIIPSSGYEVGGSSREMQDEDDDDASMSEQRVHTDDDIGSEED